MTPEELQRISQEFVAAKHHQPEPFPADFAPGDWHREVDGFQLVCTCSACPEQYDVYRDGTLVGYLRERHGWFTVEFPWVGGELLHEQEISYLGRLHDNELLTAIDAIKGRIGQ